MSAPIATTATTLEGQILEVCQALKVRYTAPDRNAGDRIQFDCDLAGQILSIKVDLDLYVTHLGERIDLLAGDYKITGTGS